jgi:hypothetical protein
VDLRTLLSIVVRRWIVVVPTIVLALLVGHQVLSKVKPEYDAQGSMLLLTPVPPAPVTPVPGVAAATPDQENPYLLSAPLDKAATAFAEIMNSDTEKKVVGALPSTTKSYTVTVDQNAPILQIDVKHGNPKVAVNTVRAVLAETAKQINAREAVHKVAAANNIGFDNLNVPTKATPLNSARTRAWIGFIALTLAAVLSVALLVESWSQSRSRRQGRRLTVAVPAPGAAPAPAPPAAASSFAPDRGSSGRGVRAADRDDTEPRPGRRTGTENAAGRESRENIGGTAPSIDNETPLDGNGKSARSRARARARRRDDAAS